MNFYSHFSINLLQGADTILELLSHSKLQLVIPPSEWANTPLALKATAGLRLLPEKQAQALLDAVSHLSVPALHHTVCLKIKNIMTAQMFSGQGCAGRSAFLHQRKLCIYHGGSG